MIYCTSVSFFQCRAAPVDSWSAANRLGLKSTQFSEAFWTRVAVNFGYIATTVTSASLPASFDPNRETCRMCGKHCQLKTPWEGCFLHSHGSQYCLQGRQRAQWAIQEAEATVRMPFWCIHNYPHEFMFRPPLQGSHQAHCQNVKNLFLPLVPDDQSAPRNKIKTFEGFRRNVLGPKICPWGRRRILSLSLSL